MTRGELGGDEALTVYDPNNAGMREEMLRFLRSQTSQRRVPRWRFVTMDDQTLASGEYDKHRINYSLCRTVFGEEI